MYINNLFTHSLSYHILFLTSYCISISIAPEMTTCRSDFERAVQRQGSITLDIIKNITIGLSAKGNSTLKCLLVHDASVDVRSSTAVLKTPAIFCRSSNQFAAKEASSLLKVVSGESMAACIRIACCGCDYQAVPLNPITRLAQKFCSLVKHEENEKSGTKSKESQNPIARPHSQPMPPEQKEVSQLSHALEQAHQTLLNNLGTGVEDQLLHTARFVHLLDTGGQPSFQDTLPLLLTIPHTYVGRFDALQDLDRPPCITYRCEGASEEEQANSETGWEMLVHSLSNIHTLSQKGTRNMANFQEKGGYLPQFCIPLVGTFKDCLIREGRLQQAIGAMNQLKCVSQAKEFRSLLTVFHEQNRILCHLGLTACYAQSDAGLHEDGCDLSDPAHFLTCVLALKPYYVEALHVDESLFTALQREESLEIEGGWKEVRWGPTAAFMVLMCM